MTDTQIKKDEMKENIAGTQEEIKKVEVVAKDTSSKVEHEDVK